MLSQWGAYKMFQELPHNFWNQQIRKKKLDDWFITNVSTNLNNWFLKNYQILKLRRYHLG